MYLHCRYGFVEADCWDGTDIPGHEKLLNKLRSKGVVVVRSRRKDTLENLTMNLPRRYAGGILPRIDVLESLIWDYRWRVYLTPVEWAMCLTRIAMDLDYRNFKHTALMSDIDSREYPLALAIWTAAFQERGE